MKYESACIPFKRIGNRRGLTGLQLMEDPELAAFVKRFPKSFEYAHNMDVAFFIEPKEDNDPTA